MAESPETNNSEDMEDRVRKLETAIQAVETNIEHHQTKVPEWVKHEENEMEKKEEHLRHELSLARTDSKDARARLKKITQSQSTNKTTEPDKNAMRPTHIAAKFSSMFEKEWTDAYQSMKKTEQNCVTRLLNLLKDVYTKCKGLANDGFLQQVQGCIQLPFDCPEISNEPIVMPDLLKQQIKEFRKRRAAVAIKQLQENLVATFLVDTNKSPEVKSYVSRCIEICWLMVIQDPPMVFEYGSSDGKFDRNMFDVYETHGQFVVWPAMLLHGGGKLLSKGKFGI